MVFLKEIQNKNCVSCSRFLLKRNGQLAKGHYETRGVQKLTLWSLLYQQPPTLCGGVLKLHTGDIS